MDMKKILQAFDSASTKSVEGANAMSKFLRIVSEGGEQVPAMPDIAGLQPGTPKDLGNGEKVEVNQDGTVNYSGAWGTHVYNAQGQHVKTQSPSFAGYSQTTDAGGNVTQQNYSQGPLSIQQGPEGTQTTAQVGQNTFSQTTNTQGQPVQQSVQESGMSKFLSIIDKNNVQVLNEGANPHKVSLPVQMAMQHYSTPVATPTTKKPSLLKQYFAEAEEQQAQELAEKQERLKMYSKKIANRVLVKESELKDKDDLKAKRKALQDIQMDPATSKDPQVKKELAQRKAALEKEAKKKGLAENQQQAVRDERTIQQEVKALSKELEKIEYATAKARQITKEIKYDNTAGDIMVRIRALATSGIGIDESDLKYAEEEVYNAERALESAVYGLEQVFEDAVRNLKNKIDDLEGEIDEIQWAKKYGRQPNI